MTDGAGEQLTCYDARGRTPTASRRIDGTPYVTSSTYDVGDRAVDVTYPDGEVVHGSYDPYHGRQTGVCQWVSGACAAVNGTLHVPADGWVTDARSLLYRPKSDESRSE